jgi:hypothetical protein
MNQCILTHDRDDVTADSAKAKVGERGRYRERMAVRISRHRHRQYDVYTLGHQGNDIITVTAKRASDDRIQEDWYRVRNGSLKTMTNPEI